MLKSGNCDSQMYSFSSLSGLTNIYIPTFMLFRQRILGLHTFQIISKMKEMNIHILPLLIIKIHIIFISFKFK